MNPILKKLRLIDQEPVLILNAPEEYSATMADISSRVDTEIAGKYQFIQAFVFNLEQLNNLAPSLIAALQVPGYLWVCYPKGTSKKYKSDVNRNTLLQAFAPYDYEGVTQVAIDDDWSALRVNHVENIQTMNRKTATSEKGRERIKERDSQ